MKKLFIPFIALLAVSALCCQKPDDEQAAPATEQPTVESAQPTAESAQPTPEPAAPTAQGYQLTFEEILALPRVDLAGEFNYSFPDLNSAYNWYENVGIASIEIVQVKHYLIWNTWGIEGRTFMLARIKEIKDEYNKANLKTGDSVCFTELDHISYANIEDAIAFFSKCYKKPINSISDLEACEYAKFELIPKKGEAYKYYSRPNSMPLKEGECYTAFINTNKEPHYDDSGALCCLVNYISPANGDVSFETFLADYGFYYDQDILKITEEVAALFR